MLRAKAGSIAPLRVIRMCTHPRTKGTRTAAGRIRRAYRAVEVVERNAVSNPPVDWAVMIVTVRRRKRTAAGRGIGT